MRLLDPVMPRIASEFGTSIQEAALLTTWFTFAYALGQPILGPIGDSVGKARLMSYSLGALGIFLAAAAFVESFGVFSLTRALMGLAAGGIIPLGIALVGDRAPVDQRQFAIAKLMMATQTGQVMGGVFGGGLSPYIGWRGVMLTVACIAFAAGITTRLLIKPRPRAERPPLNAGNAIANYKAILSHPRAIPLFILVLAEGAFIFGAFPYVAEILQKRDGAGSAEAGIVIAGFAIGGILFGIFAKRILTGLTPVYTTRIGGVVTGLSLLAFAIPGLRWWTAFPMFMGTGFGFFLLHNNFQTQATTLSETARASAVALFACSLFAGSAIGPPVAGYILHTGGEKMMLAIMAALVAALGFVTPRVLGQTRR